VARNVLDDRVCPGIPAWSTVTAGEVIPTTGQFDPVREPHFAAAAQADFLKDSDHVMGVSANGVSKAYRTDIITYHHIIHDQLGKMPFAIQPSCSGPTSPVKL